MNEEISEEDYKVPEKDRSQALINSQMNSEVFSAYIHNFQHIDLRRSSQ